MKIQMLNSFTNFLEKSVNILRNLVAALPDLPDLNYISHSVVPPQYFLPSYGPGFINRSLTINFYNKVINSILVMLDKYNSNIFKYN